MYDVSALRDHTQHISTAARIDLIEAQNAHAIIDIQPEGSNTLYQSTIRAVDPVARTIEIDEVFPNGFNAAQGEALKITLRLMHNRRVTFATRLLRRSGHTYKVFMPSNVTYTQRRACYRFKLTAMPVEAEFRDSHDYYCSACVLDISLMGVRLQLNHQIDVAPGDKLKQLSFALYGHEFLCDAIAVNSLRDGENRLVIGAELKNMPRTQQRALEKILAQLHRNLARQKARQTPELLSA